MRRGLRARQLEWSFGGGDAAAPLISTAWRSAGVWIASTRAARRPSCATTRAGPCTPARAGPRTARSRPRSTRSPCASAGPGDRRRALPADRHGGSAPARHRPRRRPRPLRQRRRRRRRDAGRTVEESRAVAARAPPACAPGASAVPGPLRLQRRVCPPGHLPCGGRAVNRVHRRAARGDRGPHAGPRCSPPTPARARPR